MIALRTCAGGSKYLLPSRYDGDKCMSNATLNRVAQIVVERSKAKGLPIESFSVHDLRRTGSTILNELGFNKQGRLSTHSTASWAGEARRRQESKPHGRDSA
ncbi:MAG: hypothetical protein ACYCZJ_02800 [Sulfuriferula sp.]